ncbi:class I SAM-dependent methyltransferase [Chondromyces apiculatus]|uniref:O-methyltransferase-like protein n=1 Tax=Chondromyces apiculatus DSM 436 TaxID=1192034 RepID=A0A017T1S2_9BACT|nr:class I SAM-dependent methyltransferase [Chondromyces apiculatus]EYF02937.1 O-methyltransferase-like protein [Chondromyces apiculatus DSM 436]
MGEKAKVDLGKVQETLLIPLYGRAVETRKRRPLLSDPKAVEMVAAIDYDFHKFDRSTSLVGSVLRTVMLDEWIKDFLAAHPTGTVVEIGAGLNTRFERLDNGQLRWFDVDLPDSVALRNRFFTDSARRTTVAASVLDESWITRVKESNGPFFIVVEAVLLYLAEDEVKQALSRIAQEFPGARVAFDTAGTLMVRNQHRHDVMKDMAAQFSWACDEPERLERWVPGLRLLETRTYAEAQETLWSKLPLYLRVLSHVGPLLFKRFVNAYRLNLFEVLPRA